MKEDDYEMSEAEAVLETAHEVEDDWDHSYNNFTPADTITGNPYTYVHYI